MIDTIAALSTASGPGAIGIIRVSGPASFSLVAPLCSKNHQALTEEQFRNQARRALFCELHEEGRFLDEVVLLAFSAPNSYTGEDLVEIHAHGNPILLSQILRLVFQKGARPAKNGEFTKRAFLSGKMPLGKAEAIGRLIESRSRLELELAQKNVYGRISQLSSKLRSDLISLKAEFEAEIDFSTEDLTFESRQERKLRILRVLDLTKQTLTSSKRAHKAILQSTVVLFGEPNTGKSSLMNLLVGKDRSIISDIPGTTRDYIAEELSLEGIPIRLVDTAGIRETSEPIEKMGIERSLNEAEKANLKLILLDASLPWDMAAFQSRHEPYLKNSILIANKIDRMHPEFSQSEFQKFCQSVHADPVILSCKTNSGVPELIQLLQNKIQSTESTEDLVLLEERQVFHLESIASCLERALQLLEEEAPAEILVEEINQSLEDIGELQGQVAGEEILGRIFSKFCVGK